MSYCDYCEGSFDRPALNGCDKPGHVTPTVEQRIVAKIESDMCNRRGLRQEFDQIDADIQCEIRDKWADIVREELKSL